MNETEVPLRSVRDLIEGHAKRVRLEPLADKIGSNICGFVERSIEKGTTVISDGLAS